MNAEDAALTVAERLCDPDVVVAAAPQDGAATLADGLPGTALLHARLSCVDPVFESAAHAHWNAAAEHAARDPHAGCGIYGVRGGLTASLVLGSPYLSDPDPTARATARSVRWLSACAVRLADASAESVNSGTGGTARHVYDVVSGLTGVGRVLLAARLGGMSSAEPGLRAALDALTTMLIDPGRSWPGWLTPARQYPGVVAAQSGSARAADTGVAHGVAGPLALLSAALSAGHAVPGQETATGDTAEWLNRWRTSGGDWPPYVSEHDLLDDGHVADRPGRRTAWCYGTPGIAHVLLAAGRALHDDDLATTARTDLIHLADRSWDVEGPTLCHGHAGMMRCTSGIAPTVTDRAAAAVEQHADVSRPFVFPHVDHGVRYDNPGFLTGAAGVALALADHVGLPAASVSTSWDALLLMS